MWRMKVSTKTKSLTHRARREERIYLSRRHAMTLQTYPHPEKSAMTLQMFPLLGKPVMTLRIYHLQDNTWKNQVNSKSKFCSVMF